MQFYSSLPWVYVYKYKNYEHSLEYAQKKEAEHLEYLKRTYPEDFEEEEEEAEEEVVEEEDDE